MQYGKSPTEISARTGHCSLMEEMVAYALDLASRPLSASARQATEKLLLDALGCACAAQQSPGVREVTQLMCDWGGSPSASIIGNTTRVPIATAAFANSAMVHALDLDDVYIPGILHISSLVAPATLAAAQFSGASGREALTAMAMGIEIAGRLGIACHTRARHGGFLPTTLVGGFGAVITAALLLGLNREQCVNALGMNYAQVAGNRQALLDHTLTKRLQPAFATRSALWAVELAARGITGPAHMLEGPAGLFALYTTGETPDLQELLVERPFLQIERVAHKRYPSCGACHHAQLAAERLVEEEGLSPEHIARVELFGCGPGGLVGDEFHPDPHPSVAAQFSVRWAVAHTLQRGPATLEDYTDAAVRADTEVAAFANTFTFVPLPADLLPAHEPPTDYHAAQMLHQGLIVHTHDGQRLMRAQLPAATFPPGGLTLEEIQQKFRHCAAFGNVLTAQQADSIVTMVDRLHDMERLDALIELLTWENTYHDAKHQ